MRITKDRIKDPNYDFNRIRNYIERGDLSENNKKVLRQYMMVLNTGVGVKKPLKLDSIRGAIGTGIQFGEIIKKDYLDCDKNDIINYLGELRVQGKAESTISLYSILLRQFYVWLYRENKLCSYEEIPEIVKWVKGRKVKKAIDRTKLISTKDVKKMVNASDNDRDKALVMTIFESATRRGELLDIKIKDIQFDKHGCKIHVRGKTGSRHIYLIEAVPFILRWFENHPFKDDPESYFFISLATNYYGQALSRGHIGSHLKTIAKRAGIKKHIHPHLFRHSRASFLGEKFSFNDRDLKLYCGWSENSDMPNRYLHYNEDAIFEKMKIASGVCTEEETKQEQKEKDRLKPVICSRCSHKNTFNSVYCSSCSQILDQKEALNLEDMKNKVINEAMEEFMKIAQDSERLKRFEEFKEQMKVS